MKSFRPAPPGGALPVESGLVPHQLHRWWVHAAEHLEQHCDVGWVQGPLGQHGAQRLAGARISCCCAQSQSDLAGVVTSDGRENKPPRQFASRTTVLSRQMFQNRTVEEDVSITPTLGKSKFTHTAQHKQRSKSKERRNETNGTFGVQTSAPPGQSCAQRSPPAPPGPGWTSWPGRTGRCALRDTPSSAGREETFTQPGGRRQRRRHIASQRDSASSDNKKTNN